MSHAQSLQGARRNMRISEYFSLIRRRRGRWAFGSFDRVNLRARQGSGVVKCRLSRAHGCTQMMLDRFQGRCNYHKGSADWLSLHTTTPLSYFERRFGKSIEQRYQQTLTRRIEQKSRYALYYSRAPCTFVNMACATEGCTCTFLVLARA